MSRARDAKPDQWCAVCGVAFVRRQLNRPQRYCSLACRDRAYSLRMRNAGPKKKKYEAVSHGDIDEFLP